MIANIFLPEQYGTFFLFSRRIASILIDKSSVRATIVRVSRSQRFIEELIEESISSDETVSMHERTLTALTAIVSRIPSGCQLIGILPSASIVYKIIDTPLMSLAKIKLIVPFEIESSLPFSLESALIDCIITAVYPNEKRAQVLVAATRQETINEYRALFEAAGRIPDCITTDVVALFGFVTEMSHIPVKQESPCLLLCIDQHITILMAFAHDRLVALRTLPKGQHDVFRNTQIDHSLFDGLIRDMVTTIKNFPLVAEQLFICGLGSEHKEFCEALGRQIALPCELVTINKILHSGTIQSSLGLTNTMLMTVASSLPSMTTDLFNLDRATAYLHEERLVGTQLIVGASLCGLLLALLLAVRIATIRSLRSDVAAAEQDAIVTLSKRLTLDKSVQKKRSLEEVNRIAQAAVDKQKDIWFSLATQSRSTPLIVLQELSKRINRQELGLKLQTLLFDNRSVVLEGEVKDYAALRTLEESLNQSPLLRLDSTLQDVQFTARLLLDVSIEGN